MGCRKRGFGRDDNRDAVKVVVVKFTALQY
jgi:hypothetical protein